MKSSKIALLSLVTALLVTPMFAAESQKQLKKEAKISMRKARSIALAKAPGKLKSSELEREGGKLIYSFDIRNSKGTITEVNVNAIDGSIVAIHEETAAKEAAEKKQEAKEKTTPATTTTQH
jgi:hypothetical protein